MADQLGSGAVAGVAADGGQLGQVSTGGPATVSHHGRPVSWVAVSLIMAAFVVGGLALVFGPTWWLFYASVGLAVVGGLIALATNIFEDWY